MKGIDKAFGSNQVLKNAGFFLKDGEAIEAVIPVEVALVTAE